MRGPIGWGIIGCGDVVERKAGPSFQEIPGSRLVAVMRRSPGKAEAFARRYGVPCWTTDAAEVLRHPEVSAVYVATPPEHHLAYALAACAAGKACLIEKPAGRCARETRTALEAFRSAGVPLFVSYYRPHLPKFRAVKEIVASGQLGPIVSIDYRLSAPPREDDWRLVPRVSGGGPFFDLAGHFLTLLDDWFGSIELLGAAATNVLARHEVEDAVAISFRTAGGAVGTARWNSAAPRFADRLCIEGMWGRLELECGDCASPLRLELDTRRLGKRPEPALRRLSRRLRGRKRPKWVVEERRFAPVPYPHRPLLEAVVGRLAAGEGGVESAESALRASRLMDQALDAYYGGRRDAFWEHPERWQSLRARVVRRADAEEPSRYELTKGEIRSFEQTGLLGPFRCEAPGLRGIAIPAAGSGNAAHLEDPRVFEACSHPSVVRRVAQLLGSEGVLLFKSRIRVKQGESDSPVPWHQDVGAHNGGYLPDGSPVPTLTVWLALDDATRENGAMYGIPGSHRGFYGEYRKNIEAGLEGAGVLEEVDLESAVCFEARAGEFYLFHSWLLHGSGPNRSPARRAVLNMRFAAPGHDVDPAFHYTPIG